MGAIGEDNDGGPMNGKAHLVARIESLRIGRVEPLGRDGTLSAIDKREVWAPLRVTRTGLAGDEHGNTRHHGGPEKALHHYPWDHYRAWREEQPHLAPWLAQAGAFGENVSTLGITEADVCVGDVYRMGTALVQLSQGRQPCRNLNLRFDEPRMVALVLESLRAGWYYRVLEEGWVCLGDPIVLMERPHPQWSVHRVLQVLFGRRIDRVALAALAELPELSRSWRERARGRCDEPVSLSAPAADPARG